jgi:putative membrane protein
MSMDEQRRKVMEPLILLGLCIVAIVVSSIRPHERITWILEVAPVLFAIPILFFTYSKFPLTPLLYRLLFLHALILILGGYYTYARVPLGYWVRDLFDLTRNHYDRLGHLAQGFIPAILAREILRRKLPAVRGGWLFYVVTSICLAFSAFYELLEWWAALIGGDSAESFLGTQGDVWDTQWDMFLALIGAISAQILLARSHERQLSQID